MLLCLLLLAAVAAPAQEAVRYSIANERATAARQRARTETAYNIDLDPVKLRFSASLGAERNDNVNLASTNELDDFILRPMLGVRAFWQVSERNALDLSLDFGYEYYFNNARPSRTIVTGDENSGLFFDIYIGDFVINLHDRFSLSQETSADPTVSGIAEIFRLENTVGATVTWDLNKILLMLNYDHASYVPLDDFYKYLAHESDLVALRPAIMLNPACITGIEMGAGVTRYSDDRLSDNSHTSIGPFIRYQLSKRSDFRASLGVSKYQFDPSGFITNTVTSDGFYADVQFNHRPTERTSQSLNIGQSQSTDINSAPIELFYIRYSLSLSIIRHWSFHPYLSYESGNESHGLAQEDLTRYGGGLTVSRRITEKLTGSFTYSHLKKDSTVPSFNYTQNRLVLNLLYQF